MYKTKQCKLCGNSFTPNSSYQLFCSKECKKKHYAIYGKKEDKHNYICDNCGKEIEGRWRSKEEHHFCDAYCRVEYYKKNNKTSNCIVCGKEYIQLHKNHLYCSEECKKEYKKMNPLMYSYTCDCCGKTFETKYKSKSIHKFCSKECYSQYSHNASIKIRKCEFCGAEYEAKNKTQRFCSMKCQSSWQSKYLVGKSSNTYNHNVSDEDRTVVCEVCGKSFMVSPKEVESRRFCSNECRRKWYADVWSQTDEWREASTIRTVNMISDGLFSKTESKPQVVLNNILDSMKIKYINEYGVKYFAVDNYLTESSLFIEVMGDYWHCNNKSYPIIKYANQKDRIIRDKAKHSYIKNKYKKDVLYLWESDLIENPKMCMLLIDLYIEQNGLLQNFHSFNYHLENDDTLCLNEKIIKPYMEYSNKELNLICNFTNLPRLVNGLDAVND